MSKENYREIIDELNESITSYQTKLITSHELAEDLLEALRTATYGLDKGFTITEDEFQMLETRFKNLD